MNGDGTLGSIVQQLVDDLHVPIPEVVRRKAVQMMRYHRDRKYYFSDRVHRFTLTQGRYDYKPGDGFGLPADLVEIQGQVIWILVGGNDDMRVPCYRITSPSWGRSKASWGTAKSQPEEWEFRAGALRFSPIPSSGTDDAELRYLTSTLIPRLNYENGAYVYYHPTTGQRLSSTDLDNWTNDWTSQEGGQAALMARTRYEVQKSFLGDPEGAQDSLTSWLEMVAQLENETESKMGQVAQLGGCLLGPDDDWG